MTMGALWNTFSEAGVFPNPISNMGTKVSRMKYTQVAGRLNLYLSSKRKISLNMAAAYMVMGSTFFEMMLK